MIKKIAYLGVVVLLVSSIVSCEKDFTDIGSNIINNSAFDTKEIIFDVEIEQKNVDFVRSGNTEITHLGEYLLGVYKKENTKMLEASIVSQLSIPKNLKNKETLESGEVLSAPHLDEVILKIPVKATLTGKEVINIGSEEITVPNYKIDSLLGNATTNFDINVYRNDTFLNLLDPSDVSKKNVYYSNKTYTPEGGKLNLNSTINFSNLAKDTMFVFDRTLSNGDVYKDTLKVENGAKIKANPFIVVKLDKNKLKIDLFDKYEDADLASQDAFNKYFKGIIIETIAGVDGGAMIPLNLATGNNNLRPSIDFIHTSTILDKDGNPVKDDKSKIKKVETVNSFYLGGIRNSMYKMTDNTSSLPNNINLQGTAGFNASIKILDIDSDNNGVSDLEELRNKNILLNDALLVFDVNTSVADTTKTPNQLFLYKKEKNASGKIISNHISDLIIDGPDMHGKLQLKDQKPDSYAFRIRKHLSDIISGSSPNSELILRVFNANDFPTETSATIKNYNWNPRSVSLLSNTTQKGTVRGVKLKIFYTEEK